MSRPASKFSSLLSAVQAPEPAPTAGRSSEAAPPASTAPALPTGAEAGGVAGREPAVGEPRRASRATTRDAAVPTPAAPALEAPRRRGRPAGKRSDPTYDQVTAYIRRQTYRDVRIALLTQGRGQEFSELVEELLAQWLQSGR